jgi:2-C-methyl-D-erythritol 2,4-cyclodiphosphate synthase|tara:strand:- start:1546 stop:2013 length:468 start_codon:yes stop_codon:yes gene_type:complete
MRIGQGFDAHKIIPGKGMILGGVEINSDYSIEAHSDGDIILHALSDALLGAAALGDLGKFFPSEDVKFKNQSSRVILKSVAQKVYAEEYKIENIDITFIGEQPRLNKFINLIRQNIAEDLNIDINQVSCKATSTDGLGYEGALLGVSCHAIVLIK